MTTPPHPSPRAEYTRRMNRVLNYIDRHLDQPLDLRQLAEVANFSPYHFHRVFAAWMGETLGDTRANGSPRRPSRPAPGMRTAIWIRYSASSIRRRNAASTTMTSPTTTKEISI